MYLLTEKKNEHKAIQSALQNEFEKMFHFKKELLRWPNNFTTGLKDNEIHRV